MKIQLKRAYDPPDRKDGARVLVDRLWPRGVKKEDLDLRVWLKDVAPSTELRQWFHARPRQWPMFQKKYLQELREPQAAAALTQLYEIAHSEPTTTLIYAAHDQEHNQAAILKSLLEGMKKPPSSTGPVKAAAAGRKRAAAKKR
ncbi:MAG TPA: DUF488 family protein [candidate division Zixibacteria bacterium]|nr:DUF488 family protein [candidate division Zixibacteria bacterium]